MAKKDYIGPTFHKNKKVILPEGPIAELNTKSAKGMLAAGRLAGGDDSNVEGKLVEKPLQMGPPVRLPPKKKTTPEGAVVADDDGTLPPLPVHLLGNTHINSYQTLLANDRMEKPRIKAWQDEESTES